MQDVRRLHVFLTDQSGWFKLALIVRPKEFDRAVAVKRAMSVFWSKGYAATSTDDLLQAMQIGRQSMYDTFGDKRRLYVEALERYQLESVAGHIKRLRSAASPLAGIEALIVGVISSDRATREKGCMGVGAICEFGTADPELADLRVKSGGMLHKALIERLQDAQAAGEIGETVDIERAARFRGDDHVGASGRGKSRPGRPHSSRYGRLRDRRVEEPLGRTRHTWALA
jgi:TetR/AcrR family transcriptional regulator, transcriptional repressor for nem operon